MELERGMKLAVVITGAIAAGILVLAGPAVGKQHAPKKHAPKKHYTSSGHGTYESTGQACFGAKWAGTGGWKTSYKRTTIETNVGTTTDTLDGDSSYSWDERAVAGGADCALELLDFPGSKPSGGATWNKGSVRIGSSGQEVLTFPNAPTVKTPCTESVTKPPSGGGFSSGDMVLESKGSSLVFEINLGFPTEGCDYGFPGDAVPQGKVGDFLESTSVKVPKTVFEHSRKVAITISSDLKHGPKPNCGVVPASTVSSGSSSTVKCSQSGAWQGTLTLYEG
jgi:hypothetical protein